jgi:hypothetical protein
VSLQLLSNGSRSSNNIRMIITTTIIITAMGTTMDM